MSILPIVLISALAIGFWILVIWLIIRREARLARANHLPFEKLCQAWPGKTLDDNHHEVERDGRVFGLEYTPSSKYVPVSLAISLPAPAAPAPASADDFPPILLRAERRHDRLGKALHVNREAQTGDREFDRAIYIETDAPERFVQRLLGDGVVRRRILDWQRAGWNEVRFFPGPGALVRIQASSPAASLYEVQAVERVLAQLEELAPEVPLPEADDRVRRGSRNAWTMGLAIAIASVGWLVALVAANVWPAFGVRPMVIGALVGIAVWFGSMPALGMILRGRSDSLRTLLVSLACLGFGLPPLSVGLLLGANGLLDRSAPIERALEITDLWKTTGKSTSYNLRFRDWDRPGGTLHVRVRYPVYQAFEQASPPRRGTIIVHPGALGWPWWSEVRAAPPSGD